jgi:hypothetical protein
VGDRNRDIPSVVLLVAGEGGADPGVAPTDHEPAGHRSAGQFELAHELADAGADVVSYEPDGGEVGAGGIGHSPVFLAFAGED